MKKLMVFILLFLSFSTVCEAKERVSVTFSECVDGDTSWFLVDGQKKKFRFLAVDTPESVHPTKEVQAYGKDASEYTCNRLKNATKIEVEYDEKSDKTDKYSRDLAWIWVDDSLLQEDLIRIGYATVAYVYGKYHYLDSLCYAQSVARNDKLGVWNDSKKEEGYCSKVDYSKATYINKTVGTVHVDNQEDINNSELVYYLVGGLLSIGVATGIVKKSTAKRVLKSVKK